MEEIFLRDYANNVAQAQDPFGIAAVQAQPGFENYTPSFVNQELQPMGLAPTEPNIDIKQIGKDVAMNVLKNQAMEKLGLKAIEANVLGSVVGVNPFALSNPIGALYTVGSLLPDNVKGIAEVLRSKRANQQVNKAIQRESVRDLQGRINKGEFGSNTPTPQDARRGGQYDGGSKTSAGFSSSERGAALHG
jgi:hypothetical protein